MSLVAVRECASAADVMANARAMQARRAEVFKPRPKPELRTVPVIAAPIRVVTRAIADENEHVHAWRANRCVELTRKVIQYRRELDRLNPPDTARITATEFIKVLCEQYGIPRADLFSCRRGGASVRRSRLKMYWLVKEMYPDKSFPQIGRLFERDHSSIMHGCAKIDSLIAANDPSVDDLLPYLSERQLMALTV